MENEELITKLKSIELDLFKQFVRCCKELSLNYYVLGGTMLGSVRHKGFIPWDDDIDVGMMRNDYEIFLEKAPSLLPSYYFLQHSKSEPNYMNNFAKIRDSRTTFIETAVKNLNINHGVYMDIFPLDYYPETLFRQKVFDLKYKLLSLKVREAFAVQDGNKLSAAAELGVKVLSYFVSIKYKSSKDALLAMDKLCRSVPRSNLIANYNGAWGKKEIVPYFWYGSGISGDFEGISVSLPVEYDKWLKKVYGDYLKLPPAEKRVTHHFTEIVDLDTPYLDYRNG